MSSLPTLTLKSPNRIFIRYLSNTHGGMWQHSWLRHNATSQKVGGFESQRGHFSIYLILLAALGPGVYTTSNRNE
jgi:hypothetical protein